MKHFKKSLSLLILLTSIFGSWTFAQDYFYSLKLSNPIGNSDRANGLKQDNEYKRTCSLYGTPTLVQNLLSFDAKLKSDQARKERARIDRAKEVIQDIGHAGINKEQGRFYDNRLMLNGKPLDYSEFNLQSTGEFTISKELNIAGQTTLIPFYAYLTRNGNKILIHGNERPDPQNIKIEISEILKHAEPGDHLIIEGVNKEDGAIKRMLRLLSGGC